MSKTIKKITNKIQIMKLNNTKKLTRSMLLNLQEKSKLHTKLKKVILP